MQPSACQELVLAPTQQHPIPIPQLDTPENRVEYLKQNAKQLFQILNSIKANLDTNANEKLNKILVPNVGQTSLCNKKINYYYVCVTCNQDPEVRICFDCFNKEYHKDHNYFVNPCTANSECDCGLSWYQSHCQNHRLCNQLSAHKKPEEKHYPFIAFMAETLTYLFGVSNKDQYNYKKLVQDIFKILKQLNQSNISYNIATYYIFNLPYTSQDSNTILYTTLQRNRSHNLLLAETADLFRQLCSYEPFQLLYMEAAFACIGHPHTMFSISTQRLKIGQKLYRTLSKSPYVMGQLAKSAIPSLSHMSASLLFSMLLQNLKKYDPDYKFVKQVTQIAKMFIKKYSMSINFYISQSWKQYLYNCASYDPPTISALISYQITNKSYWQIWSRKSDASWFNMIVRIVLNAVKADLHQFVLFFQHIKIEKLKSFVMEYFKVIMKKRGKCKFNGLTARCLFRIAEHHKWIDQLSKLPETNELDCCKFAKNLLIIFRNLISSDHLFAFQIYKIAKNHNNVELADQQIAIIVEWFRDFLFSQKYVSIRTIQSMKQQGLISFKQTKVVLQTQTQYSQDRKLLTYIGPDRCVNPDLVITNLKQVKEVHGIKFNDKQNLFYTEERRRIFEGLFGQNIEKVVTKDYLSYSKRQRYQISLSAVILDKLMQGKHTKIRKYVQKIQQLSKVSKNPDARISRLFSSQIIHQQIKAQTPTKINDQNFQQNHTTQPVNKNSLKQTISNTSLREQQQSNSDRIASTTSLNDQLKTEKKEQQKPQKIMTESDRKRAQKMRKLKQKFSRKSSKYSSSLHSGKSNISYNEQTCLICRDSSNHDRTFLYYLGSLKADQTINILLGLQDSEKTLSSCFHAYHQKCLAKTNTNTCILCKFVGNCILPVMNESPQSQYFTNIWWKDFLAITSFTPKTNPNNYYGNYGYYNNNNTNAQTKTPQKGQSPQKRRTYDNFMLIYRSIIHRVSSLTGQNSWESFIRKIQYFCHLLQNCFDGLHHHKRIELKNQINEYVQRIRSSLKLTDYIKDLSIITCSALLLRLEGAKAQEEQKCEEVRIKCEQVIKKYPPKFTESFMKKIQWLIKYKIKERQQIISQHKFTSQQLLQHVFNLEVPSTMLELSSNRSFCAKCNQIYNFYCLFCKKVGCRRCQNPNTHAKQVHGNACIIMLCVKTGKLIQVTQISIRQIQAYFDTFQLPFNQTQSKHLKDYKISKPKVNKVFDIILKRF